MPSLLLLGPFGFLPFRLWSWSLRDRSWVVTVIARQFVCDLKSPPATVRVVRVEGERRGVVPRTLGDREIAPATGLDERSSRPADKQKSRGTFTVFALFTVTAAVGPSMTKPAWAYVFALVGSALGESSTTSSNSVAFAREALRIHSTNKSNESTITNEIDTFRSADHYNIWHSPLLKSLSPWLL